MKSIELLEYIHKRADERFDRLYPPEVRDLSQVHWTPVGIARRAAEFLVCEPGARVLDVGCGPGKFCIVGALTTPGCFTGIEQRRHLCDLACERIRQAGIAYVQILQGNVTNLNFSEFDAFYLFNPFEENLEESMRIDGTVRFSGELYERYTEHVAWQLAKAPMGTRVATYCGLCEEVPIGYDCLATSMDGSLKFWEKTREHPKHPENQAAAATNNKWRFMPHGNV